MLTAEGTGPDARAVINALLERPWRVLHITGHISRDSPEGSAEIALSDDTALGPREFAAMRVVPEFVFVNCGYGATRPEQEATAEESLGGRSTFASRLAKGLLDSGVRCIVVAGAIVEDDTAAEFAETLYRELLSGRRFRDAIAAARQACHDKGGRTWTAYQCYGNPDWQLRPEPDEDARPETTSGLDMARIASHTDLVVLLESIEVSTRLGREDPKIQRDRLTLLEDTFGPRWGHRGQVAEAFGRAWAAAGATERAIDMLTRARNAPDGEASGRSTEQLADLHLRLAQRALTSAAPAVASKSGKKRGSGEGARRKTKTSKRPGPPVPGLDGARDEIHKALTLLEGLAASRSTLETYSLWGSAYKRLSMLERAEGHGKAETRALEDMRRQYYRAEEIARASHDPRAFYPALNRMAAELASRAGRSEWKGLDRRGLEYASAAATSLVTVEPDFWSLIALGELNLYDAISSLKLASRRAAILRQFDDIHIRVSAQHLWRSVYENAAFVLIPYARRTSDRERVAAETLLDHLRHFAMPDSEGASNEPGHAHPPALAKR